MEIEQSASINDKSDEEIAKENEKMHHRRVNDSVHWFISELSARVIAESGIPSDRYHLGKLILQSFKDAPDFIAQIDGGTGESETFLSAYHRTVKCATAFRKIGLQRGDVIVLMGLNHIDLAIPLYAALYVGIAVAPIDRTYTVKELHNTFSVIRPKMVLCQSQKAPDVQLAVNQLDQTVEIITFDKGDYLCSFSQFLEKFAEDTDVDNFRPTDFDPEETISFLIPTSGTTGASKSAVATHKNFAITNPYVWIRFYKFPTPTRMALIASPLQWLSAIINFILSPILRYTRLQSSSVFDKEHVYYLFNTYKPTFTIMSPPFVITLIKSEDRDRCDFTCLNLLLLGGSAVSVELIDELKTIIPNTEIVDAFGMTEITSIGFCHENVPPGSCGKPLGCYQYRLVDMETGQTINEPNQPGELWVKGPGVFKGYYNNPMATKDAFAEDCWFKTGDMFLRDQNWNFFFVERIKLLLKHKGVHISPVELENVIRSHPGVLDAAVTGIPDPETGDLAVACVVRQDDSTVTAQDIKDLVKESSGSKELHGGVIFMDALPLTASSKIHRIKLKQMVLNMERE